MLRHSKRCFTQVKPASLASLRSRSASSRWPQRKTCTAGEAGCDALALHELDARRGDVRQRGRRGCGHCSAAAVGSRLAAGPRVAVCSGTAGHSNGRSKQHCPQQFPQQCSSSSHLGQRARRRHILRAPARGRSTRRLVARLRARCRSWRA